MANTSEGSADILDAGGDVVGETTYSVVSEEPTGSWYDVFKDKRLGALATTLVFAACNVAAPKTPEPTAVPPTPSPIVSESPFPTPTLLPTDTPIPVTPSPTVSPTPEITPSPSPEPTPIDSMLEMWENMTNVDRWLDANNTPQTFGLLEYSPELPKDQRYTGVILGAKKLGDNDGVLYVGMEDYFRNRYVVTFKLNRSVILDPTNDNFNGSIFDGGDVENIWTNELLERISNGRYLGNIINIYQPIVANNLPNNTYRDAVIHNEPYARSLHEFGLAARDGDYTTLVQPEFINNSNATDGPLLKVFAILER